MRKIFILSIAALLLSSCSSSDEGIKDWEANPQVTFQTDAYSIEYSLKNAFGDKTTTFKEGENIVFNVVITNLTGSILNLADERTFLLGLTTVYRADGEFFDNPYDSEYQTDDLRWLSIEPNGTFAFSNSWKLDFRLYSSQELVLDAATPSIAKAKPLTKGSYYSMLKGRIQKHFGDKAGYDDIEMKIPFVVK